MKRAAYLGLIRLVHNPHSREYATRACVTQTINLTNLAPDIQQAVLDLEPTTDPVPRFREREVRTIANLPNWEKQRVLWKRLVKRTWEAGSRDNDKYGHRTRGRGY